MWRSTCRALLLAGSVCPGPQPLDFELLALRIKGEQGLGNGFASAPCAGHATEPR
jgi:hypothetical protein